MGRGTCATRSPTRRSSGTGKRWTRKRALEPTASQEVLGEGLAQHVRGEVPGEGRGLVGPGARQALQEPPLEADQAHQVGGAVEEVLLVLVHEEGRDERADEEGDAHDQNPGSPDLPGERELSERGVAVGLC